jgi:uncharacterized protein YigE (DUF2233 family)
MTAGCDAMAGEFLQICSENPNDNYVNKTEIEKAAQTWQGFHWLSKQFARAGSSRPML